MKKESRKKEHKNKRHRLWKQLHVKYKVSIINESTLGEIWKFRASKFMVGLAFSLLVTVVIIISSVVIILTPIRNYLPGYLDSEVRAEATHAAIRTDSIEREQGNYKTYYANLMGVFEGKVDSIDLVKSDTLLIAEDHQGLDASENEKRFNAKFEEEEKYNLSAATADGSLQETITFFRPVKGLVSDKFNPNIRHYGVDLVAAPKESVMAVMEGTVVFSGYDPEVGYVIQLQHKNGFISVYKHNAILLKKMGDKVKAGEAIAIVGNTGKLSTGAHLHFELWEKGTPVNPELYISF